MTCYLEQLSQHQVELIEVPGQEGNRVKEVSDESATPDIHTPLELHSRIEFDK